MQLSYLSHGRFAAVAQNYPDGDRVEPHQHREAQFLYAVQGLMRLVTAAGAWVIPPTRGVWIPPGVEHQIYMSGAVQMRTLFIDAAACPAALDGCCVLAVTPLLRELILRAIHLEHGPAQTTHYPLVQQLIVHELATLQPVPLYLPMPKDRRLRAICQALLQAPQQNRTLEDWGLEVGASSRTLARLFADELGLGFHEWRQQLRLTEALPRLLAGDSLQSVAQALGLGSAKAFSAMFQRLLGERPRSYLNRLNRLANQDL
ncbi:MAG: helix-turn-helix transcriptional regulator [Pseudomonadota bacterium]